jgi:hypothetical protein
VSVAVFRARTLTNVAETLLELVDGHLIVDAGGRFLLDTGSPVSFSRTGSATWAGQAHGLATSTLGLDADELSSLVGTPLDGLIGGNLLGLGAFTVDLERRVCSFGASDRGAAELPLRLVLGVPLATIDLDGVPTETCIDTGAKLSYLDQKRLRGREASDETDDFYPGFGAFRTPVYEIPVCLADAAFDIRVGSLPDALSGMLGTLGIGAILGTDLFTRFPVVRFDYPASRVVLGSRRVTA